MTGAALLALYASLFAIAGSTAFARAPAVLGAAVTFDLTATAAVIVWWLAIRRGALPAWSAVVVFSWGVAAARAWVPHAPLGALVAVGGALEVATACWIAVRGRRLVRAARAARAEGPIGALEAGLVTAGFPARLAPFLASELAVGWLALTGWFRRPAPGGFSMRSTGWLLIAGVISFVVIPEAIAFHVLLAHWSAIAAWLATASSLYLLLWIIGDAQAVRLYPVRVSDGVLRVMIGVRWRVAIPVSEIASVTAIHAVPPGALDLSLLEPTVLVSLRSPAEVRGLFGRRRRGDRIALTIDDAAALCAAVARPA